MIKRACDQHQLVKHFFTSEKVCLKSMFKTDLPLNQICPYNYSCVHALERVLNFMHNPKLAHILVTVYTIAPSVVNTIIPWGGDSLVGTPIQQQRDTLTSSLWESM